MKEHIGNDPSDVLQIVILRTCTSSSGFICQIPWILDRVQILANGRTQAVGEGGERREAEGSVRSPSRTHLLGGRVKMGAHRDGA